MKYWSVLYKSTPTSMVYFSFIKWDRLRFMFYLNESRFAEEISKASGYQRYSNYRNLSTHKIIHQQWDERILRHWLTLFSVSEGGMLIADRPATRFCTLHAVCSRISPTTHELFHHAPCLLKNSRTAPFNSTRGIRPEMIREKPGHC